MMDTVGQLVVLSRASGANDLWRGRWTVHRRISGPDCRRLDLELIEAGETQDTYADFWKAAEAALVCGIARAEALIDLS